MSFKFSYDKLLKHRHNIEEVARRDYYEAFNNLEVERQKEADMRQAVEDAKSERFTLQTELAAANVGMLSEIHGYLEGQKIKIASQEKIIANHTLITDQKREILVAAAKETKILEKLKEKKLLEFKKEMKKKDAKETDELIVTRFHRKESA